MADKTITCVDCKSDFIFSDGEQKFFASKGLTNEPKRCPPCRKVKRERDSRGDKRQDYSRDRR